MPTEPEIAKLKSKPAYYHGNHRYSFRGGEASEIIGVRMVETKYGERACFVLLYWDGFVDYSPLEDIRNYTIDSSSASINPQN